MDDVHELAAYRILNTFWPEVIKHTTVKHTTQGTRGRDQLTAMRALLLIT